MNSITAVARTIHYLLLVITLIFLFTGVGITYYPVVEQLTGGQLTKPLSFQIHTTLTIPFIVLLILHILLSILKKKNKKY